ncbi:hypothetical protein KC799_01295 [candidate division KSB1 bacterium]|nr:hypothetical protein [candidate division KSB1 bacterium]
MNLVLTLLIMLLMYQVLAGTPVPEQTILQQPIKEDITIVQAEILKKFMPEKFEFKPPEPQQPKREPKQQKTNFVPEKKVNLNDLKSQLEGRLSPRKEKNSQPQTLPLKTKTPPALEIGSASDALVYQHFTTETNAPSRIIVPKSNPGIPGVRDNDDLDVDKTSSIGVKSTGPITDVPSISVPKNKVIKPDVNVGPAPEPPEIKIKPQVKKIAPIYPELIAWLKKNPSQFSPTVRKFMGASDEHLTSHVQFRAEGKDFEIFIACHEQQFEIRICLVEGQQTTLLIDKDFKKQSNFFRIGTIHRGEDNRIFSFGTSQESPSDARTNKFYQVFLSWWETTKTGK